MHPTFDRLGALLLLAGTQKRTLRKSGAATYQARCLPGAPWGGKESKKRGDRRQGDGTRQPKREGGGPDRTAAAALSVLLLAAKRPFAWLPADLDPIVSNYAVGPLSSENEWQRSNLARRPPLLTNATTWLFLPRFYAPRFSTKPPSKIQQFFLPENGNFIATQDILYLSRLLKMI